MNYEYKKTSHGDRHTVSGVENGWNITLTVYTSSGYHPTYFITASREDAYSIPVWSAPVAVSTLRKTFPDTLAYLKERAGIRKYKGV